MKTRRVVLAILTTAVIILTASFGYYHNWFPAAQEHPTAFLLAVTTMLMVVWHRIYFSKKSAQ